jgi:hypothetical protein
VQEYAAFETLQHIIRFTQKNGNPKLTQGTSPYPNMLGKTLCTFTYIMCNLIVHFTQRTQYMQYSMGNTHLIVEVIYFPLHFCTGVQCLPHRLPAHASFICLCNDCAGCPKSPGKTCIYISVLVSLPLAKLSYPPCLQYCSQLYQCSWSSSGCG